MPLFILKLENRILFDAAAPAVVAHMVATQTAGDHSSDQGHHDTSSQTQTTQSSAAPPTTASEASPATSLVDVAPDTHEAPQVNVLLVASNVENAQQLADAKAAGVITIVYDYNNTTLDQLQVMINQSLNGKKADTIAF